MALVDPGTGRISQERALSADDARRWAAQRAAVTGDGTIIDDLERLLSSNGIQAIEGARR